MMPSNDVFALAERWAENETGDTASLAEIKAQVRRAYIEGALTERVRWQSVMEQITKLETRIATMEH